MNTRTKEENIEYYETLIDFYKNSLDPDSRAIGNLLIPLDKAKNMYKLLSDVVKVLDKFTINYALCGGSLLGYMRNKSMIPWDDDLDLMIFEEDEVNIKKKEFIRELNALGYNLINQGDGYAYHVCKEDEKKYLRENEIKMTIPEYIMDIHPFDNKRKINNNNNSQLDIFIFGKTKFKTKEIYTPTKYKTRGNVDFFDINEVYPLKKVKFGDIDVNIPNIPNNYLRRMYGINFMSYGYITHVHNTDNREIFQEIRKKKIPIDHILLYAYVPNLL